MRKNAFISYSIKDTELFVLSSISRILDEKGYDIYSSYNEVQYIDNQIKKSSLFIGIASHEGIKSEWVMKEWEFAQVSAIPSIFLIENTVNINPQFIQHNLVLVFDRLNPTIAMNQLYKLISLEEEKKTKKSENLVVGGLIGLALMTLLSNK